VAAIVLDHEEAHEEAGSRHGEQEANPVTGTRAIHIRIHKITWGTAVITSSTVLRMQLGSGSGRAWAPTPRIPYGMDSGISFMHSELAPYSIGALLRHAFLILGSKHFCAILLTRKQLDPPVAGAVGQSRRWHMTASDQFSSRKPLMRVGGTIHT
jgi:hypothetical protein